MSSMTVRSDDGRCLLSVAPPDGGSYASFGVSPAPEHGKAFLYTLNGQVQVSYTPSMGYAGSDTFTAILIRGPGQKRDRLTVNATVDATGVVMPKPAVAAPAKAGKEPAKKTTTRRRHK
ncbi:Ig-like domain-containing protein [Acetobacter fallax]|uniref:Ig-like domain-containing protein n=1 Tax=Acetobacter fallax TaxID=1737473 RepID=UPI001F5590EE|nr:Ig-like domain-containing protein [Acetobacter fallax]